VPVVGDEATALFRSVGEVAGYPRWNFYKYLIDKNGKVVNSWSSFGMPDEDDLKKVL
jgi:glutathione peroxidase